MNDAVDRKVEPHDQGSRLETNHFGLDDHASELSYG